MINDTMEGSVSTVDGYVPSMSITKDGKTAYFSKGTYEKPLYGVFSKKELIYLITLFFFLEPIICDCISF